jgi:hypothetical protein
VSPHFVEFSGRKETFATGPVIRIAPEETLPNLSAPEGFEKIQSGLHRIREILSLAKQISVSMLTQDHVGAK